LKVIVSCGDNSICIIIIIIIIIIVVVVVSRVLLQCVGCLLNPLEGRSLLPIVIEALEDRAGLRDC
jgi:hypothetical protein